MLDRWREEVYLGVAATLDGDMLQKVVGYYIYRSEEVHHGHPIIDGIYAQRRTFAR